MAGAVANLMVRAGFDGGNLQRGLQQMQGQVSSANEGLKAKMGSMSKVVGAAAIAAGAAVVAIGAAVAKVGVSYDAMQESSMVAWTTLLGTQAKAKQQIQDIAQFAAKTQFDTEGVDAMAKYFFNAGIQGKALIDQLTKIADVSGAFNISADNAKELSRQMSQVVQAGTAYTEDLNILQDQGVPIYKAIAKELNTNVGAVRKLASQGKISSDIYMKAFNDVANTVKGSADKQSQTFNGMISTMKDDLSMISGALAKPLFDKMKEGMTKLLPLLDSFKAFAQGDVKTFSTTLENTFGPKIGGMIVNFASTLSTGLDKGKQVIKAFADYMSGNSFAGFTKLFGLGLSQDQLNAIDGAFTTIKGFITGFSSSVSSLFKGKNSFGSSFTEMFTTAQSVVVPIFKDIVSGVQNGISQLSQFWNKDGSQIIQAWKDNLKTLADIFKNVLAPAMKIVWDSIKTVGIVTFKLFMDAVNLLGGHMKTATAILGGVLGAIVAFNAISKIITLVKAWREASILMTAAQAALNVVLDANPIGLIAIAIGGLVAAGIALYQNWDTVSSKMSKIWSGIERGAASMVNGIITKLDDMIRVINKIPGVSIPLIPKVSWGNNPPPPKYLASGSTTGSSRTASLAHYAIGTDYHQGGLAMVGEHGPEIVDLPTGSKVKTNYQTNNLPDAIASAVGTAVFQAMQFNKPSGNQVTGDVILQIDGKSFARIIRPFTDFEQTRVGKNVRLQQL